MIPDHDYQPILRSGSHCQSVFWGLTAGLMFLLVYAALGRHQPPDDMEIVNTIFTLWRITLLVMAGITPVLVYSALEGYRRFPE